MHEGLQAFYGFFLHAEASFYVYLGLRDVFQAGVLTQQRAHSPYLGEECFYLGGRHPVYIGSEAVPLLR